MVKFLLKHPIAVSMVFITIFLLGIIALKLLPISLMPDVDIPRITIKITNKEASARELEANIISKLRQTLAQVIHLDNLSSETRDGNATIKLEFEYGTNIDFAFFEVNEKIDRIMPTLPKNQQRPIVIKANATDIPVFNLNLSIKNSSNNNHIYNSQSIAKLIELSNFANTVIRRRIEQIPQVAFVDISGQAFSEITISPDKNKLVSLGLNNDDIENSLNQNNLNLGNIYLNEGEYQYSVRVFNKFSTIEDIGNISIYKSKRQIKLKEVSHINIKPQKPNGLILYNGEYALSLAIIKQSDSRIKDLEEELSKILKVLSNDYPNIVFSISQDQTKLLNYTINNLRTSLALGALFAFIVMFFFLRDIQSPLLIAITIPLSLALTFLLFYFFNISINIISLSGLILGIGMMIDNSIIVIDNIDQNYKRYNNLNIACIKGTNEVFRPMLSSVLTTCAVFIPLIFLRGISGTLFFDQAIAVTLGLFVSLIISITILPVYYNLFYNKSNLKISSTICKKKILDFNEIYKKGFRFTFKNQFLIIVTLFLILIFMVLLFFNLKKEKFPKLTKTEINLRIDWNEPISLDENLVRVKAILNHLNKNKIQTTSYLGEQQYLFVMNYPESSSESLINIETINPQDLKNSIASTNKFMLLHYPHASYNFEDVGNLFELIFSDNTPNFEARIRPKFDQNSTIHLTETIKEIKNKIGYNTKMNNWQELYILEIDPIKMLIYDIDYVELENTLITSLNGKTFSSITDNQNFIPISIREMDNNFFKKMQNLTIKNNKGVEIPISSFIKINKDIDLKVITSDQAGEYFAYDLNVDDSSVPETISRLNEIIQEENKFSISYVGSFFNNKKLLNELLLVLLISILLLYLILASQFESLCLPLIIILEVPIDLFGVFIFLKIFGASINLMSMIGIVVLSGIIVNDSILKIDTINKLYRQGVPLLKAILIGGQRRLKPILMTSITTILALLPFLFGKGMGNELQKPLAYGIIGGMIIGTLVSLYIVPLMYYYIEKWTSKTKV
jgi:multidrug efflux pump subunit AcrB